MMVCFVWWNSERELTRCFDEMCHLLISQIRIMYILCIRPTPLSYLSVALLCNVHVILSHQMKRVVKRAWVWCLTLLNDHMSHVATAFNSLWPLKCLGAYSHSKHSHRLNSSFSHFGHRTLQSSKNISKFKWTDVYKRRHVKKSFRRPRPLPIRPVFRLSLLQR